MSIKIPKSIALKRNLKAETIFNIVMNPSEEKIEEAKRSGFILYPKEVDNEKGETA